ncbi:MAG: hypothetical protein ACRYFS_25390 [Janthinobacterium lividum]
MRSTPILAWLLALRWEAFVSWALVHAVEYSRDQRPNMRASGHLVGKRGGGGLQLRSEDRGGLPASVQRIVRPLKAQ